MHLFWRAAALVLLLNAVTPTTRSFLISHKDEHQNTNSSSNSSNTRSKTTATPGSSLNRIEPDLTSDDATNFFSSDLGNPFDSSSASDYGGSVFDSFPGLPYFPDFGEIFRIQRTTTPEPPFRFPSYVREAFPERPPESPLKAFSNGNGRRGTARRLPRPASSGTRTKVQKQNHHQGEVKEKAKPTKSSKSPAVGKARDYPKIFRFTADRVNLADFDMKKKMNENYLTLTKGDDLDSDKVKRNKFLILHGGVFEIERSGNGLFRSESNVEAVTASLEDDLYSYSSDSKRDKEDPQDVPYY